MLCKNISKSVLAIEKTENSSKNAFQDHRLNIDGKTLWKQQRSKSELFQDHTVNLFQDHGKKCPNEDSFKTIHQKSGKVFFHDHPPNVPKKGPNLLLSRPLSLKMCQKRVLSRPWRMDLKTTLLSRPLVKILVKMTKNQLLARPLQIELKTLTLITWSPLMR